MRFGLPNACSLFFCMGLAVALSMEPSSARAQASYSEVAASSSVPASASAPTATSGHVKRRAGEGRQAWSINDEPYIGRGAPQWRYFVEFRARNAASYGHLYVMFGKVNDRHEIIKSEVAGFFPAGDDRNCVNCSVYTWTIGHVLPVPSEIGASDGDLEEQYVLARFRVWVDAEQYQNLIAYINERKANKGFWNAFLANCVTFGRDVASFLKVKMPPLLAVAPSVVMYPKDVVDALREANGLKQEQMPLRDAAGERMVTIRTNGVPASKGTESESPLPSASQKRMANGRTAAQPASGAR
jgi:hypothetical protein